MSDPMTELRYEQLDMFENECEKGFTERLNEQLELFESQYEKEFTERLKATTLYKVSQDLYDRQQLGIKKYGCRVDQSPDDMLQHLYEELLDACMYIKTEIERRKA